MMEMVLYTAMVIITIAVLGIFVRIIKGPYPPDRILGLDAIGTNLIALIAIWSMISRTYVYLDLMLLIGVMSFIGTVAYARFLERGVAIEYDPNHENNG